MNITPSATQMRTNYGFRNTEKDPIFCFCVIKAAFENSIILSEKSSVCVAPQKDHRPSWIRHSKKSIVWIIRRRTSRDFVARLAASRAKKVVPLAKKLDSRGRLVASLTINKVFVVCLFVCLFVSLYQVENTRKILGKSQKRNSQLKTNYLGLLLVDIYTVHCLAIS